MQRFILTCAIGLGLWSALLLYSQVMTPLTRARERPKQPPQMAAATDQTVDLDPIVQESLSNQEWIKTADLQWQRSQQAFMYAGRVHPDENSDGSALKMSPFAMVWKDPRNPDRPPMTVVSESARVRFEKPVFDTRANRDLNSFNLISQDAGRIVAAALDGNVRISGPDQLMIEGRDFIFSEETAQLYSDYEISFRFGPPERGRPVAVRGQSLDGLTISFIPLTSSPLGNDMPRVAETPKSVQLRGRVSIDFITQEQNKETQTRVSSQGPFQYEFATKTAVFVDRVVVTRPRPGDHRQEIDCNWLALAFTNIESPKSGPEIIPVTNREDSPPLADPQEDSLLSGVELLSVRAMAKSSPNAARPDRMKIVSTEHGLSCELDDLTYDARQELLTMTDPERVNVTRELGNQIQKFEAPTVEILHRDRTLERLSGIGSGRFSHRNDRQNKGVPDIWSHWKDRIDLIPNDQQGTELTIRGLATLGQRDQMRFNAASISALLLPMDQLGHIDSESKPQSFRKVRPPQESVIQRITAGGDVTFAAPGIVGRQIQEVDLQIVSGQIIPVSQPQRSSRRGDDIQQASAHDPNQLPLVFETARLTGVAVYDPATRLYGLQELHGFEGVKLWREGAETASSQNTPFEEQPVRVTAREFSATNNGGTRQILELRGVVDGKGIIREPVIARIGGFSLEGPQLIIDREKNLATIPGQGVLRFPVDRDFSGQQLATPEIADLACLEKIEFDGQRATFLGSVKASVLTNVIYAEQMQATLNQRLDFSADQPTTRGFAIDTLLCQDKVRVEMYEFNPEKNWYDEIMKARMHSFELNQKTGDFVGTGPGKIQDWRRAGTRRMLVQNRSEAQANRPADTNREYPWEYVGIEFEDQLTGNVKQQWGRLNERVQLIYAPVKIAHEVFVRDNLSSEEKNAANAIWIGSEKMTVVITDEGGHGPLATVEALQDAEMEGQMFYARAYSLRYEQAQEMFTLQGKGQDHATLNVYRDKNGTASKLPAQLIQFFPSRQEVIIDKAKTFTTMFGGSGLR